MTPREVEILNLVGQGLSNLQIGRLLKISRNTVRAHLHNIYQKLGVANRTAAAVVHVSGRATAESP